MIFASLLLPVVLMAAEAPALDAASVERFAELALSCVHQEYPNKIGHVLASDEDIGPPRELTPTFYGCFDWHSSVHGHWLLARLSRLHPEAEFTPTALAALEKSFSVDKVAAEVLYLNGEGRATFERPYGLAWLLCLADELHSWPDEKALKWSHNLAPLEMIAAERFRSWLGKLHYPIRTGEHSQTAFAFGLVYDWAETVGDAQMTELIASTARRFYLDDVSCPLSYEPSGQDFLSPCIAEADLMRRILKPEDYAQWLTRFLPQIPAKQSTSWLPIGVVTDRTDGKLAHLDGLNISRAWMLEGIAAGLPQNDPRRPALLATAELHRTSGLASVTGDHYEGGHWLGSFATYLVTGKGR
ncbi:MAG: DUF2891 domain-containing protein [Acidobacteria bacterium]|nr:MAG: DUF2891 domain-containing protein [Acidobacteriota bacterium]